MFLDGEPERLEGVVGGFDTVVDGGLVLLCITVTCYGSGGGDSDVYGRGCCGGGHGG